MWAEMIMNYVKTIHLLWILFFLQFMGWKRILLYIKRPIIHTNKENLLTSDAEVPVTSKSVPEKPIIKRQNLAGLKTASTVKVVKRDNVKKPTTLRTYRDFTNQYVPSVKTSSIKSVKVSSVGASGRSAAACVQVAESSFLKTKVFYIV